MSPSRRSPLNLTSLFDEHQKRLLALALRITGDFALAEDAFQQTFLRAHAAAASFRGESSAGTWLYRITAREAVRLRARRAARREQPFDVESSLLIRGDGGRTRGESRLEWQEETARLLRSLDELPEDQRLALVLLSGQELSAEEIGVMLGVSPTTIYTRAFRARLALRERLGARPRN